MGATKIVSKYIQRFDRMMTECKVDLTTATCTCMTPGILGLPMCESELLTKIPLRIINMTLYVTAQPLSTNEVYVKTF